ncbi:MFS general substrate transporter [Mollisia scopiformis]|uniref:MFS general substrate transporter n=1 Tax=Mollisia scopiformis TaxID=149040 RepID=A0A194X052_MOLSC|nr:MFS general substrate transporter [Mollisia scopiformis]KUJ13578.1 MFS general substrate transporter [Mollisia scopiformis]
MAEKSEQQEFEHGIDEKHIGVAPSPDLEDKDGLRTVDAGLSADQALALAEEQETRRVLRKIDLRLVPLLSFLYLIAYVDRSNIGNAKIAGMATDLNLIKMRYNTALTVFFVPYSLFEVPSNIVLKILRPSIWISILCFAWGLVMTLMGVVSTYHGLIVARFFLGVAEAGFFPAATYLLTIWYKRYEVQRRMAIFYAAASLSGAFSGLLAYAIEKMNGIAGLAGWKWIFILEGLVPVVVSFFLYFLLPDRPETAKFLTKEEREFVINRIALQTGSGQGRVTNADKISWQSIKVGFADWKVWMAIVPFWACSIGTYGFTATVPSVLEEMGYKTADAQLLTIPIYVFALIATVVVAFLSDYYQQRTPFIMAGFTIAVVGFIAELAIPHPKYPGVTYFFLFLVAAGLYCPFTCVVTLVGNNLAPSSKRAVGMALMISVGNMGGICGSNIYFAAEEPKYPAGFGTSLGICAAGIVAAWILRKAYQRENRKRDELLARDGEDAIKARYTEQELLELGDLSPFYRYTT